MRRIGVLVGGLFLCCLINCDSSTGSDDNQTGDDPGPIITPAAQTSLLLRDTIEITWTHAISNVAIAYNSNDTLGADYGDAAWHTFTADSGIVAIGATSARVCLRQAFGKSENFRLRVTETVSGKSSESGQLRLDNVVLLSPLAGQAYAVGQPVPISFKRNRYMSQVVLTFVVGGGGIPVKLVYSSINFMMRGLDTVSSVLDTTWTIGSESWAGATPQYPSDSCYLYAYAYGLGEQFRGAPVGINSDHNAVPFRITAP